jgi:hypothetical protein
VSPGPGPVGNGGWREPILRHFTPQIAAASPLTVVADPDRLLAEQSVLEAIRQRGFDLITFEDSIAFRYAYESRYRRHWDEGRQTPLVVLLRAERDDVDSLPFDLLTLARRNQRVLRFSLAEIFPSLSPGVVAELDPAEFDRLYQAVQAVTPTGLGERATRDFVLRHVYEFAPELVKQPEDLIRLLLRRHYRDRQLPAALDAHQITRLEETNRFAGWPLERIVPDRQSFFAFLEERWPVFVRRQVEKSRPGVSGAPAVYNPAFAGPAELPFDHEDVRVYIDNLFIEGHLTPTDVVPKKAVGGTWLEWGVAGEAEDDARARFVVLSESIRNALPDEDCGYRAWIEFATRWSEWSALRAEVDQEIAAATETERLWHEVDARFAAWMLRHFGSLHNLAYLPSPAMVHHVVRFIARRTSEAKTNPRVALLVLDGLSGAQWVPLRESLEPARTDLSIRESGVFAWVPTITPVSRQAIFAGEAPLYFAQSITTTAKDEQHWRRFWDGRGIRGAAVQFVAPRTEETEAAFLDRLLTAAAYPACTALAAVVPTIDAMAHGAVTGARGLFAQVSHWAREGHFRTVVEALVKHGFAVHVTSDHGNVECTGIGRPNVGVLAGERSKRALVFNEELIRQKTGAEFTSTISWPPAGLPESYLPLLAAGRGAFTTQGNRTVSHGGISLEEVVVPFITIEGAR